MKKEKKRKYISTLVTKGKTCMNQNCIVLCGNYCPFSKYWIQKLLNIIIVIFHHKKNWIETNEHILVYWVYYMSWFKDIQTHRWTRFVCMPNTPLDGQGLFVCPTYPWMDKVCLYARHTHVWTRFVWMPDTPMDGQGLFVCPTHPCMDKVCLYARHTHGWTRFVCMPVMIKNTKLKYNLLTSSQNTFIDNKYCDIHLFSRSQSRMEVIKKSAEYYLYSCQVIRCFHVYPVWY